MTAKSHGKSDAYRKLVQDATTCLGGLDPREHYWACLLNILWDSTKQVTRLSYFCPYCRMCGVQLREAEGLIWMAPSDHTKALILDAYRKRHD